MSCLPNVTGIFGLDYFHNYSLGCSTLPLTIYALDAFNIHVLAMILHLLHSNTPNKSMYDLNFFQVKLKLVFHPVE